MPETSSDSSDDEIELKKLKEAAVDVVDIVHHQASVVNKKETKNFQKQQIKLPSKRNLQSNDAAETDELDVTPEFRSFLARKLGELVDSQIEDSATCCALRNVKQLDEANDSKGVKLLSISRSCLTVDSNESQVKTSMPKAKQVGPPKSKKKKRKKQSNSSSSDTSDEDDEKLQGLAVSGDFIVTEARRSAEQRRIEFEQEVSASKITDAKTDKCAVPATTLADSCDKSTAANSLGVSAELQTDTSERMKHKKKKRKHASE